MFQAGEQTEWNKEKGCLEEIQRIENLIHSSLIINDFSAGFNGIRVLKGIINPLLTREERDKYTQLLGAYKAASLNRSDTIKSGVLMDLYDFIQSILISKGIHLRKEIDDDEDDI